MTAPDTTRKGIIIGDDCWIGSGVIFLDGARVGDGCVVGAGAVVRGHFPPRSVIVGMPARVVAIRGVDASNTSDTALPANNA